MGDEYPRMIVDTEHYAAVGKIAAEWSAIEHTLNEIIMDFLDVGTVARTNEGRIMTANLNLRQRTDAIMAYANYFFPDTERTAEFKSIAKVVTHGLSPKRNRYIHCEWYETRANGTAVGFRYGARGRLKPDFIEEPISNLTATADEIMHKRREIEKWQGLVFKDYSGPPDGGAPIPSPDKSR